MIKYFEVKFCIILNLLSKPPQECWNETKETKEIKIFKGTCLPNNYFDISPPNIWENIFKRICRLWRMRSLLLFKLQHPYFINSYKNTPWSIRDGTFCSYYKLFHSIRNLLHIFRNFLRSRWIYYKYLNVMFQIIFFYIKSRESSLSSLGRGYLNNVLNFFLFFIYILLNAPQSCNFLQKIL